MEQSETNFYTLNKGMIWRIIFIFFALIFQDFYQYTVVILENYIIYSEMSYLFINMQKLLLIYVI